MTHIIDGTAFSESIRTAVTDAVAHIKTTHNITPGLAVVLVGDNPASLVYVTAKTKQTKACGMQSFAFRLPADVSQADLLQLIDTLNHNPEVHGILVQLPLPAPIDTEKVINAITITKDVDGFHVLNAGLLATGTGTPILPCTPYGCLLMLQQHLGTDLSGKQAVIIGRSNIVGKPMAQLLLNANATVTIVHSRTPNITAITQTADILIAAAGKPHMVTADWVKPGAVIIDVGINHITTADGNKKLVGDVDYNAVFDKVSAITPVPGGVGPMTIAMLLLNTTFATCAQHNIPIPTAINGFVQ